MCYTGDILDEKRDKYTLQYYINKAKELEKRGAHIIAIKDMSSLLKPMAAYKLVSALKKEIGHADSFTYPRYQRKRRSNTDDGSSWPAWTSSMPHLTAWRV